tara:strand:- start:468 stop:1112 length:645 start_codon:yes stop_codon:yes gene_type:complete
MPSLAPVPVPSLQDTSPFQYALTRNQSIALVLVEPLGCIELVQYIIHVIKDEQMKDSRREHLRMWADSDGMIDDPEDSLMACEDPPTFIDPYLFPNIQCLQPGFMKVLVPSEENDRWRNHRDTYSRPYNLELVPGMMDMGLQKKLEIIENYLSWPDWTGGYYPADSERLHNSWYRFNMGLNGSTDEGDYGGVILITHTPEQPMGVASPIDLTIL